MKRQRNNGILLLGLILVLVVILTATVACWGSPTFELIIENQREYDLTVYVNGYEVGKVSSGKQITDSGFSIDTGRYHVEAKNMIGEFVFSKTFTFEQMQRIDNKRIWKAVIPPLQNK